ncbi:hypothetical protein QCA50_004488 [Cerrena zonata]|uniref:Alpha/beta hydrolase fold-3 domain-containing protein n=1 Tax=Cerrena zonata TaxID=2478898 RepID=A0AAW0GRL5_9APHY
MEGLYRKQPFKSIYLLYQSITTPLFRIPIWTILSLFRSNRPKSTWSLKKTILVKLLKHYSAIGAKVGALPSYNHLAIATGDNVKGVWVHPTPHLILGDVKQWAENAQVVCDLRIPGYWLERKGESKPIDAKADPGETVLYALHGGGYRAQSAHPSDGTSQIPLGILQSTSPNAISRAFTVEYRLSAGPPYHEAANPFPAALVDAIAGYNYLVNEVGFKPENIIVEGDSAGANLALALVRYLIENKDKLPPSLAVPNRMILSSPWSDLGTSDQIKGSSIYTNLATDFINVTSDRAINNLKHFLGPLGLEGANRNRYISPASTAATMEKVSFEGFPKTFIYAGGVEILRDQIRTLRDKMVVDLGEDRVTYHEAPDGLHDFVVFSWFEPERTETLKAITRWLTT